MVAARGCVHPLPHRRWGRGRVGAIISPASRYCPLSTVSTISHTAFLTAADAFSS